ncbi:MAG: glycosyltransferase [Butyrivibrio sp.]|nr:glycosyltransferase [Butyrivibrio sp.]
MRLQTILFPNKVICNEEALYLHKDEGFLLFDGYFNLFYLEKHHKYCDLQGLTLELNVRGIKNISLMHDKDVIRQVTFDDIPVSGMDRLRGKKSQMESDSRISLELPYDEYKKGVFWFKAEPCDIDGDWFVEGHYEGVVSASDVTQAEDAGIELAVNICTFRREPYVTRNMKSLTTWLESKDIDGRALEASEHMKVFIVDNGKTLLEDEGFLEATRGYLASDETGKGESVEAEIGKDESFGAGTGKDELCEAEIAKDESFGAGTGKGRSLDAAGGTPIISVIPNANTGGAGGFGRGMLETINRKEELSLTHILMMDDDAVFDPDLFVRLYGFLSVLRPEYRKLTVGGALMREDYRYIQHAAGEEYRNFKVINHNLMKDMRSFDTCTQDWVTGTEMEKILYGAWWCCCYSMDVVTKDNLPLPIFVHHDDIQFGLRQLKNGIVFLNGVNVWHQGFEMVFPGVKQYYNMRNALITGQMYEPEIMKKRIKSWALQRYIGLLINYRYADCDFVYRGIMDFLKGKDWLLSTDPEALHKQLMADYKRLFPEKSYDEIRDYVKDIPEEMTVDELRSYYSHARFDGTFLKKITFNGWFLPGDSDVKVITPLDSPWDTYRHKNVLLYAPGSKKGAFVKRSNKEFFKGMARLVKMCLAVDFWKLRGGNW